MGSPVVGRGGLHFITSYWKRALAEARNLTSKIMPGRRPLLICEVLTIAADGVVRAGWLRMRG